jgi:Sporulation and spore germination/Immunoglobulin-like domain of bacterial spore germination
MNRSRFWLSLLLVACAGFALGRITSGGPEERKSETFSVQELFPVPPRDEPGAATEPGDLAIEMPTEGAEVSATFLDISGRAKLEGGPLTVSVHDASGEELATAEVEVVGRADEEFGRFSATINFPDVNSGDGTLRFAREGWPAPVIRKIRFVASGAAVSDIGVLVYFHNGELGPADDCNLVFPVERRVSPGSSPEEAAKNALAELLKGPTVDEKTAGYTTALPENAAVNTVMRDQEGRTSADFAASLERGVAGSCRVGAIRSQIENTLRHFPETRDIVISVDGRIDDALQP